MRWIRLAPIVFLVAVLPVGGLIAIPPRHPHFAWAGPLETIVQVHGIGPTDLTFVNPGDDPRTK